MEKEITNFDEALEEAMLHLVQIMRHVLGNIQEEKHALISGNAQNIPTILLKRSAILNELTERQQRMSFLLRQFLNGAPATTLEDLSSIIGSDKLTILSLRDQILALADNIERQNFSPSAFQAPQPASQLRLQPKRQALAVLDKELND